MTWSTRSTADGRAGRRVRVRALAAAAVGAAALVPAALLAPAAQADPATASADLTYQALFATAGLPAPAQVYEQVDVRSVDYHLPPGDMSTPVGQRDEMFLRQVYNTGEIDPDAPHYVFFGGDQLPAAFSTPSLRTGMYADHLTPRDPATLEPLQRAYDGTPMDNGAYEIHPVGALGPVDQWGTVTTYNPNPLSSLNAGDLPETLRRALS